MLASKPKGCGSSWQAAVLLHCVSPEPAQQAAVLLHCCTVATVALCQSVQSRWLNMRRAPPHGGKRMTCLETIVPSSYSHILYLHR